MKVYVAMRPVDFRKGIDGLALAVQEMFGLDPFYGAVFVFRAKRADRIKLLVWDQTGMVLVLGMRRTRPIDFRGFPTLAERRVSF